MDGVRTKRWLLALAAVVASGCGASESSSPGSDPAARTIPATTTAAARAATTSSGDVERIDDAAISTIPAERIDNEVVVTWIGGSHVEIDDRSLPAAVRARLPRLGTRPLTIVADVRTAPLPADIELRVERAAAQGTDGLIVPLNVSWVRWDGAPNCDGLTPAYVFYACILEPPDVATAQRLLDDVRSLVGTIVATRLPAYIYIIPHSAESLADPLVADLITGAEADLASLDPGLDRIEFGTEIPTRGLSNMREGIEFFDMVHPTVAGVEALADLLAPEFERFFDRSIR